MRGHLRGNLWLLTLSLFLCCVLYPLAVLGIAKVFFPHQGEGSLIDEKGQPVTDPEKALGSRLIAQPFTADESFQPRPSAVSYNAAASGASNWGANNYLLRDRVARQLGPIVKYGKGVRKGQPVAPDIESWFHKDRFQGRSGIVSQWAQAHPTLAQNWVKADKKNGEFVEAWLKDHPNELALWKKDNPDNPEPKPEDLASPFFTSYSATFPGTFPGAVEHKSPDGRTETKIEPVKEGKDIQSLFFDMWRQEHPDEDLEAVPADMVMASGSGLDPDITLKNALYQLDRVAGAWAKKTNGDERSIRREIERLLNEKAVAPLGGLAGVKMVNVLEINLALRNHTWTQGVPGKGTETTEEVRPDPAGATGSTTATPEPSRPDPAGEFTALRSQVGEVSNQLEQLHARLDQHIEAVAQDRASHDKVAAELKGLEAQVARLAEGSRTFPALVERVDGLDARAKAATEHLQALRAEVGEARDTLKQIAAAAPAEPAKTEPVLAPGLDAFRQGRYAEAADAFLALTTTHPDDARVWYFAALAKGLATKQWRGEAEELVNKGVEREQAGTPGTAAIDAAFAGLSKTTGKDWLGFYRQRAGKR